MNDLKYSKNDLEIEVDELSGQLQDAKDEISRVRNLYEQLKTDSHNASLKDSYLAEIKEMLERGNPDIQRVASLAIKNQEFKLHQRYMDKMKDLELAKSKFEEEKAKKLTSLNMSMSIGKNGPMKLDTPDFSNSKYQNLSTDMRGYIDKLEKQIQSLESDNSGLTSKIRKLENTLNEKNYDEKKFAKKEQHLRDYISQNSVNKAKASLLNRDMNSRIESLLEDIDDLKANLEEEKAQSRQNEVRIEQYKAQVDLLKDQKSEDQQSYDKLLQNFLKYEFSHTELVNRLDLVKNTIHDILEYLELLEGGDEDGEILSVRRKNFMENLDVFLSYTPEIDVRESPQHNSELARFKNLNGKTITMGNLL